MPYVDGLVLSHPEQVTRLRRVCPEAVDASVVAGDPCFDRMLAARAHRDRFRRALGVRDGQRLVVLNSTWNPEGLFGSGGEEDLVPGLLPRLAAELPADDFRLAAVLHPNIWYGHGPGQLRAWLDEACRHGLALVDPVRAWRQAVLAADVVVGDFGSVSYYAAALDVPVLIAAPGTGKLVPGTPLASFVRDAPRFDPHGPLRAQLDRIPAGTPSPADAAAGVTSVPGASATLLRRHFYRLMDLAEPQAPALLEPLPLPEYDPPLRTAPLRVRTRVDGTDVAIERASVVPYGARGDVHAAVHEDTRDPAALEVADLIVRDGQPDDPRLGGWQGWSADVVRRFPQCAMAVFVSGPHRCFVRTREGEVFRLSAGPDADLDPAACASSLYAWLSAGGHVPAEGFTLRVRAAARVHPVRVRPLTPGSRTAPGER